MKKVNNQGILIKLNSAGIGVFLLCVPTQFISNRSQCVVVDGCRSSLVKMESGVALGNVLGPLLFILYTPELFSILENKFYYSTDYS